jgi:hypothetical protein
MEFSIPWQNWNIEDIKYGLAQNNTRIENGLFVPIYFSDKNVTCQAFHVLTPEVVIKDVETIHDKMFLVLKLSDANNFGLKLGQFDQKNLEYGKILTLGAIEYQSALKGDEWYIQIPDSGIFSCYDTKRKSWYASNEAGLLKRKWRILARTSGLWINQTNYGMDWKLIGAFVL